MLTAIYLSRETYKLPIQFVENKFLERKIQNFVYLIQKGCSVNKCVLNE